MSDLTAEDLIDQAISLACQPVPTERRAKAAFGERIATNCYRLFADANFAYQMLEWPKEYEPGFDVVFLAYRRSDVATAMQNADHNNLGLLEPWEVGSPTHCILVEAKCSIKSGNLRTYLTYNRRRGYRQMSLKWVSAVIERSPKNEIVAVVKNYLERGLLQRCLILKSVRRGTIKAWHEWNFIDEKIDLD